MRALIVDDARTIRMILGKMLRELGFECEEAGDGQEAWETLQKGSEFDIALVDWNMPVMDGFALVQTVRADASYNDMKIMMVTTESEMANVVKAIEAGANEYVMKPFTKDVILEKLKILGID